MDLDPGLDINLVVTGILAPKKFGKPIFLTA